MLFATLDPTMRKIVLPSGKTVFSIPLVLYGTSPLNRAFKSTREVQSADLILHVRDISHADSDTQS